jgi:hypothetical protein
MTQLLHNCAVGTDKLPAPTALSIADILQALAFGACMATCISPLVTTLISFLLGLSMQTTGDSKATGNSSGFPLLAPPSQPSSTGQAV